jgi:UDP-2,4-diacetamido-2,4,6-trideoxy-beta-L-altropyranose hydrolase
MKILFRVDSSSIIGTGHKMRCLTLANALRARGAECLFVCRNHKGNSIQKVSDAGFEVKLLNFDGQRGGQNKDEFEFAHAAWLGTSWQVDAEQTIAAIETAFFDWIVVDHYALDVRWESALRPYCSKLMVIDDLADRKHSCDLLLNQNLIADLAHRYDGSIPDYCARLLGPDYALLQPEYAVLRAHILPRFGQVQHIFVFFGGADIHNCTGRTTSVFLSLNRKDISIDVVVSPGHQYENDIREQVKGHTNITIHGSLPSLAELMAKADLAVGAGGATSWERCCLGLPSLVVTLAENQKPIASELGSLGVVRWVGHHDQVDDKGLKAALLDCLQQDDLLDWSERCMAVVDGKGCERVASIILLSNQAGIEARPASADDEGLILRWANDPLVRQNSFNPYAITAANHHAWFSQRLRDVKSSKIYIIQTNEGIPIGQVRFEKNDENWEIHYALDQYARFRGVGCRVLDTAISLFKKQHAKANLFGRVKIENLSSQKIFRKLGFEEVGSDSLITYYLKLDN